MKPAPTSRNERTAFHCLECRIELNRAGILFNDELATIVVIVGTTSLAACRRHAPETIETGLRRVCALRGRAAGAVPLYCHAVEVGRTGEPMVGRMLFSARDRRVEDRT